MLLRELAPSKTLAPIPPGSPDVILTPASYVSWEAALAALPNAKRIGITPGDYVSWGALRPTAAFSGTAQEWRKFFFYDANASVMAQHPVQRINPATEARLFSVRSEGAAYVAFQGLTVRGQDRDYSGANNENNIQSGSHHVVWDRMLVEESLRAYGLRLLQVSDIWVQNSVFRTNLKTGESLGIQSFPNGGAPMQRLYALDNEIYDHGDGIGASQYLNGAGNWDDESIEVQWHIEGNDIYLTEARQLPDGTADAENALDFKTGSDTYQGIIRGNRVSGFRRNNSSATGDAFVFHRAARNYLVEENIIGDCPIGIVESKYVTSALPPEGQNRPRHLVVRRNEFCDIKHFSGADKGAAVQPIGNLVFEDNWVARCDYALYTQPTEGFYAGGPSVRRTIRIDSGSRHPESTGDNVYNEALNMRGLIAQPTARERRAGPELYALYQRKRWTGPEWAVGARPSPKRRFTTVGSGRGGTVHT